VEEEEGRGRGGDGGGAGQSSVAWRGGARKVGHNGGQVGKGGWGYCTQGYHGQCWRWRAWDQLHPEFGVQEA
jgi:hypothetical protein